jgi:hypothetical protein
MVGLTLAEAKLLRWELSPSQRALIDATTCSCNEQSATR